MVKPTIKLIIYGRVPSKKNSRRLTARYGRVMSFPSKDYSDWHGDACRQMLRYRRILPTSPIETSIIRIVIFAPNRIKGDLTNKAESIMDLLVDNRIITDDNWFNVGEIVLTFGGVDKKEPRAEVEIKEIN